MADQALFGNGNNPGPFPAKLMNLVFHVMNCLLVYFLFLRIGTSRFAALVGALVFGVHPLQVSSVAWIAERKNLLVTFFYLSGLISWTFYAETKRNYLLFLIFTFFVGGLLSKPSMVTFPVALAAMLFTSDLEKSQITRGALLTLVLLVGAFLWGLYVLHTELVVQALLPPIVYRPLLAAKILWFYFYKFILPIDLAPVYPKWNILNHVAWSAVSLALIVFLVALLTFFRRKIDSWILFGWFFFLVNIALVSGFVPFGYMSHSYVADHFMYLPMIGISMVIARSTALLLNRFPLTMRSGKIMAVILACWIAGLGYSANRQTSLWHDAESFWEAAIRMNPYAYSSYNNYGSVLLAKGDVKKAEALFIKAAQTAPTLEIPLLNLIEIYRKNGNLDEAYRLAVKAESLNPKNIESIIYQDRILIQQNRVAEAKEMLQRQVAKNPQAGALICELALCHYIQGDVDRSLVLYRKAKDLAPFLPEPYIQIGAILLSKGEPDEAIQVLEEGVKIAGRVEMLNVLGAAYAQKGKAELALSTFLKGYELGPNYLGLKDNVANAFMDLGRNDDARAFCEDKKSKTSCSDETLKRLKGE